MSSRSLTTHPGEEEKGKGLSKKLNFSSPSISSGETTSIVIIVAAEKIYNIL